ncbi:MAG: RNA-binding domain-containing protein [Macellibacteroides fermentans]|uniref:RNA-binding domain-containing protein n=1 Tax=Macellibacteroides fermentans TaxID=879969 RepID=UPI003B6C5AF5
MSFESDKIKQIISRGEGLDVEFKESFDSLSRSVFETICAFLNRKGGHILLGVADNGEVVGVNKDTVQNQLDTLNRDTNNPQIISPTFYLATEVVEVDGKTVIYIYVPESSQPHTYKGVIYDRNGEGDTKLTNQQLITNLYLRKQDGYTENKVFPYLRMEDFETEMFKVARNYARLTRDDHPWLNMTDEEILVSARMRLRDVHTGVEGYTLAAALLFGKENTLAAVLPHYKTDALCRKVDVERYDDRDDIRCNLMGAYSRLLAFIRKHLPDRFYLEGTQRMSIRELIFREMVANLLVHREFSSAYPATMTIYKDVVVTENWNRPYMMGRISLENLKPHPKNPTIANFFKQLGWVEELGSGIRKMYKYCPIYVKDALPVIEEGDVFKLTIRHEPDNGPLNETINDRHDVDKQEDSCFDEDGNLINETINETINDTQSLILNLIKERQGIDRKEISIEIKKTLATVSRYIASLKARNLIEYRGSRKTGGYYLITKRKQDNSK